MATEICSDYNCAERVALALVPVPGLAAVLLGGVGDDWLRAPAYPYAVVMPSEAESARGSTTRTIRVRLVVRAADAASKPDSLAVGYGPWTFAEGLLEAARENLSPYLPALATDSHLEIFGNALFQDLWLVMDGHTAADGYEFSRNFAAVSVDGLAATMSGGTDWATAVVPVGGTVATRAARTLLRVGAGPALDALVQTVRETLSTAALGAPLESIATSYDPDPQFPVQSAELLVALNDPQAYGDAF